MRLSEAEKVALANFGGHAGCSGPQPTLMRLVKAKLLVREDGTLHDHVFRWAPGGEQVAERVRAELASKVLVNLSRQAVEALLGWQHHPEILLHSLGHETGRLARPITRTPLGGAVADLAGRAR